MILDKTSEEFRKIFLAKFTKEIIIEVAKIKNINITAKKKNIQEKTSAKKILNFQRQKPLIVKSAESLAIPETKLPERLNYLTPSPTEQEIGLGKLNPLLKDPMVRTIECNGAGQKIVVRTTVRKITNITLGKEEINEIIKKISEETKIPVHEGIFKVAFGKIIFSAIISEVIDSKFIIKKINNPFLQNQKKEFPVGPKRIRL